MELIDNPKEVLELLFRDNPQPMWIYRLQDWQILDVNKAATEVYGYTKEEFLVKTIENLRPEPERKILNELLPEVKGNTNRRWDFRHQDKYGKIFWVQICSYPLLYNDTQCRLVMVLNLQDILDFKAKINKQANELQKVLDNSLDVICSFDTDGCFVQCSRASEKIWGYTPKELVGRSFRDFLVKEDLADSLEIFGEVKSGREVKNFNNRYIKKDGTLIHIAWSARWDNREQTMFCIARDASERINAEMKAIEQNRRMTTILESITDGFFTIDENWLVTHWNKEAERILQMPKEKILNKRLWEVFDESVLIQFYPQYYHALEKMTPVHFEEYSPRFDVWLDVTAYPSTEGFSVHFKDATERIRAQALIKESKDRYDMIASVTNDIIWDWDIKSDKVEWGMAFEKVLGYKSNDENQNNAWWVENLHPDDRQRVERRASRVIKKSGNWSEEYRFKCADGSYKFFFDRGYLSRNEKGEPVRMIGSMQDITELKEKEAEIHIRNKRILEIAYENSHHVRKPLANILGIVSLLQQSDKDHRDDLLKMLQESSDELDGVLKSIAGKTSLLQD